MSLYHETADILSAPSSSGGNLKTRIFGGKSKNIRSPQQQVYALALETCKWSSILKEVIDNSEFLLHERKLTPLLALLLVHDLLLSRKGIALPASHGLRVAVERHKTRLTAELIRARLRRKVASIDALRQLITIESLGEAGLYPRWVRVNTFKSSLQDQLGTTFKDFTRVTRVEDIFADLTAGKLLCVDEHVPNLLALSPAFEITKTPAYTSGSVILQDKASCFPAYLLNPQPEDGDVIDSCSAPGNKTTHLAAIVNSRALEGEECKRRVYAFEKDQYRGRTLEKMVNLAGAQGITRMSLGRDFLKVDPYSTLYKNVGALLLDPSCSGSGIVGRDVMPAIHLPAPGGAVKKPLPDKKRKRKREVDADQEGRQQQILIDDDGKELVVSSDQEMKARLEALSSFQLSLLLHAFAFPAAQKITYSTCSIHAEENEQVVLKALQSEVAVQRGWRIMKRNQQVAGMRRWPVRGSLEASGGDEEIASACIRSYKDDGRGVMGFFVAGFVRDPAVELKKGECILHDVHHENLVAERADKQEVGNGNSPSTGMASDTGIDSQNNDPNATSSHSSDSNNSGPDDGADSSNGDEWDGFDD